MPYTSSKNVIVLITFVTAVLLIYGAHADMTNNTGNLPKTVGIWTRPDSAQIVDESTIFNYMNGAGELYLAYRFGHLEVFEYTADQQDTILAEVYVMEAPEDAFGLLSLDWEGESITYAPIPAQQMNSTIAPPARALYGGGLLRMAAGSLYARIMAYRETPESREAVLALGEAIAANRKPPAEPELLKVFPQAVNPEWTLRSDRIGYFRSYLVLNSFYYLSHQNILNLDHSTEAVTAPYEHATGTDTIKRVQLLGVNYPTLEEAQQALALFHATYLPDRQQEFETETVMKRSYAFEIEDGWVGYALENRCLFLVLETPTQESAHIFLKQMSCEAANKE